MLQPLTLRGAGGHSRQWAEPCWRLTRRLVHHTPILPLPYIFQTSLIFKTIHPTFHPFRLSFISPSLPAYFLLLSLSLYLHVSTDSGSKSVWHPPDVQHWFSSSRSILLAAHSLRKYNWMHLRNHKELNDHCPCAFVCVSVYILGKESKRWILKAEIGQTREWKAGWHVGHHSHHIMTDWWTRTNNDVPTQSTLY